MMIVPLYPHFFLVFSSHIYLYLLSTHVEGVWLASSKWSRLFRFAVFAWHVCGSYSHSFSTDREYVTWRWSAREKGGRGRRRVKNGRRSTWRGGGGEKKVFAARTRSLETSISIQWSLISSSIKNDDVSFYDLNAQLNGLLNAGKERALPVILSLK